MGDGDSETMPGPRFITGQLNFKQLDWNTFLQKLVSGWGCRSAVEHLLSTLKALD
jgi:hypothetical protein